MKITMRTLGSWGLWQMRRGEHRVRAKLRPCVGTLCAVLALSGLSCGDPPSEPASGTQTEFPKGFTLIDSAMGVDRETLEEDYLWRVLPVEGEKLAGHDCLFVAERPPQRHGGVGPLDGGGRVHVVRLEQQVSNLHSVEGLRRFLLAGLEPEGPARREQLWVSHDDAYRGEERARWLCYGAAPDFSGKPSGAVAMLLAVNVHGKTYIIRTLHWPYPPTDSGSVVEGPGRRPDDAGATAQYLTGMWAVFR